MRIKNIVITIIKIHKSKAYLWSLHYLIHYLVWSLLYVCSILIAWVSFPENWVLALVFWARESSHKWENWLNVYLWRIFIPSLWCRPRSSWLPLPGGNKSSRKNSSFSCRGSNFNIRCGYSHARKIRCLHKSKMVQIMWYI